MSSSGEIIFDTRMNASGFEKDAGKLGNIVKGLSVFEVIKKGMSMITQSIDAAVSRYDTLNRFPKIMVQMGHDAGDASASMDKLSDSIQGLPTTLDEIASSTQQLTIATGSLDKGTDSAIALNNAFLASGASAANASRGMTQYIQMLNSGKVDMVSWRSLQETMPYALQKTAEAFGFAGASAQLDLYAALRDGELTFTQFNDKIIELNNGVGGFAEVAKTATVGIGTAMTNMKTRTVMGVTSIIAAIDRGFSKTRFKSIENIINTTSVGIKNGLQRVAKVAEFTTSNIAPLSAGVVTLGIAANGVKFLSLIAQMGSVTAAAKAMTPAILLSTKAKVVDIAETVILTAMYAKQAVVKGLSTLATTAENIANRQAIAAKGGNIAATITQTVATTAASAAQWALNAAMMASPVGLVVVGVLALVAAVAGLVSWLGNSNKAYKAENKELKDLKKEHKDYDSSLNNSMNAAQQEGQEKVAQTQHNRQLLDSLAALTDENGNYTGSADEAALTINQLNENVEGLGLAFDETTGQLNMSSDELKAYGKNLETVAQYEAAQTEYNKALEERNSLQAKINALEEKRKIYNKMLQEGKISQKDYNKLISQADELLGDYSESMVSLEADVQAYGQAAQETYNKEAEIALRRQDIVNNQMEQVEEYARKFHLAADQIIAEASKMEGGLSQWGTESEKTYAAVLVAEEDYVEQIKAGNVEIDESYAQSLEARRLNGEELNNIEAAYLEQWKSLNQEALDHYRGQQKEIVDAARGTKEAIVLSEQQSAAERLEIQRKNNEATAQYVENYNSIWGKIPAEHRQHLSEMTVEDARFLQDIASTWDSGGQEQWNQYVAGIQEGIATSEQLVQGEAIEFAAGVGSAMDGAVASNAETLAVTGGSMGDNIMTGASTAIQGGTAGVNGALDGMASQVQGKFAQLSTQVNAAVTQMMTSVVSGISTRAGAAQSAANGVSTGVITAFTDMKNKSSVIVTQMMTSFVSGISTRQASAQSAAQGVTTAVVSAFNEMIGKSKSVINQTMDTIVDGIKDGTERAKSAATGVVDAIIAGINAKAGDAYNAGMNIGEHLANGMVVGLENRKNAVYAKAEEIANTVAARIRKALDERSPSHVAEKIFQNFVLGMIVGMEDEESGLYRTVDTIAENVVERMGIISETMAAALNQKMRLAITANQTALAGVPVVATAAVAPAAVVNNFNMNQTIHADRPMSPGDNSRAAEAMFRRIDHQIK